VTITGHLLSVTDNFVDPHCSGDCSFLAVDLGGDVSTVLLRLCHNVAAVGRERHSLIHLLLFHFPLWDFVLKALLGLALLTLADGHRELLRFVLDPALGDRVGDPIALHLPFWWRLDRLRSWHRHPVRHLLANLLHHILALGCARAAGHHSLPPTDSAHVSSNPAGAATIYRCAATSSSCWRLWRDDSWILAGGGATTNARVVWLHAGGADRLLHHLVLTRLLTANWLRHFVALLLVLNPVVDDAHFIWWLWDLDRLAFPTTLLHILANSLRHLTSSSFIHSRDVACGDCVALFHSLIWQLFKVLIDPRESFIVSCLLSITLMALILPTLVLSLGAAVLHWDRSRLWSSGVTTLLDWIGVAELLCHCLADRLVGVPAFSLVLSVALLPLLLATALLGHPAALVHHAALVTLGNATSPNTARLNDGSATSPSRVVSLAPFPWLKSPRVVPLSTWTTTAQHRTKDISRVVA